MVLYTLDHSEKKPYMYMHFQFIREREV